MCRDLAHCASECLLTVTTSECLLTVTTPLQSRKVIKGQQLILHLGWKAANSLLSELCPTSKEVNPDIASMPLWLGMPAPFPAVYTYSGIFGMIKETI